MAAKAITANRIVNATDVRYGDGASQTSAAYSPNPIANLNSLVSTQELEIIEGKKELYLTDLAREMRSARPTLRQACQAEIHYILL